MRPVHKSGGAPWVRVASSAQSRLDGPLFPNAPPAETARWKRRVPRHSAKSFRRYGADGGGTRRFVACSNAYASSISRGSLQAKPVKPTPNGAGFAAKLSGNGGAGASGAFGTKPNGTMIVG